jgi:hypothetical protein
LRKLVILLTTLIVAMAASAAFAAGGNNGEVYGPAGYSGPPAATTIVATDSSAPVLTSGDHVVICHAIGGPNGTRFIQIAPSTGVAAGHMGHEGARDIIPPFTIKLGASGNTNDDAKSGQNWTVAGRAIYANGCAVPGTPPPPPVVVQCPEGTSLSDTIENEEGAVVALVCVKEITNTVTQIVNVPVPGPTVTNTVTQTVYGHPTCPDGTTEVSRSDGSVVCLKTETKTVEKPVVKTKVIVKTKVVIKKVTVLPKPPKTATHKPSAFPYTP